MLIQRIMKLSLFLCVVFVMTSTASALSQQKVTVRLGETTIKTALDEFRKQTNRIVFYGDDITEISGRVVADYKDVDQIEFLTRLLSGTNLTFTEINDNIVIVRKSAAAQQQRQTTTLKGVVRDVLGNPLVGVTVVLKENTRAGTTTDAQGHFSMTVWEQAGTLIFSYIGYKSREIAFRGNAEDISVRLEESASEIEQVVVTGYQTIDRTKSTAAVQSIKAENILNSALTSIDQMLEGRVQDMIFVGNSGEVGVTPKLRIRGTSTLIGNRDPLWVVDGIVLQDPVPISPEELNDPDYVNRIGNAIAGMNPQDIERIDILKDAAATAIYGAKAANGVIVVTTKKGHIGKPVVGYNFSATMRLRPRYTDNKVNLMNSQERIGFSKDLIDSGFNFSMSDDMVGYEGALTKLYSGLLTYDQFTKEVQRLEAVNTDWFDLLTEDSFSHQHTLSVSGGSESLRYYTSLGYVKNNDVIKTAGNERYTAAINLNGKLSERFSFALGINGNISTRDYVHDGINVMDYAYKTSRTIPAYNEDGSYYYYLRGYRNREYKYNVLNEIENSSYQQRQGALSMNATLNLTINDWLNASAIVSYSYSSTDIEKVRGDRTWYAAGQRQSEYGVPASTGEIDGGNGPTMPFGGELYQNTNTNNSYMARIQVNANKTFGGDLQHNINGMIGWEVSSSEYRGSSGTYRGYYEDRGKQFANPILADYPYYSQWLETNAYPSITDNLENLLSGYATVSYSYKNFFTLNANARIDGSNKFGDASNDKLLPIWSVSGNYNISEHAAIRREWMDFIIFKASYGFQGNMLSGQSPVMIIRKGTMDVIYNELISNMSVYPNPNLRWEKTESLNAGIDMSLFQRRVQLELSAYHKKTKDAFMTKQISTVNGIQEYIINSGTVRNYGYSMAVTLIPVRTKNFQWTFATSFSKVFNQMQSKPGSEQYELEDFLNGSALVKGQPVGTFYSYRFLGLSPLDGGPLFYDYRERQEDLEGLGKYDTYTAVLEASGSREPTMSGNLNNVFRYRNWRLNTVFAYSLGSSVRMFRLFGSGLSFNPSSNVNRDLVDRWRKAGDENRTNIPAIVSGDKYGTHYTTRNTDILNFGTNAWNMYDYSNARVVSGNYLKCSDISLTYQFTKELISKAGISRLEISLATSNLFTVCSPELRGQTPSQGFTTVQLTDRPTFTFGVNISF